MLRMQTKSPSYILRKHNCFIRQRQKQKETRQGQKQRKETQAYLQGLRHCWSKLRFYSFHSRFVMCYFCNMSGSSAWILIEIHSRYNHAIIRTIPHTPGFLLSGVPSDIHNAALNGPYKKTSTIVYARHVYEGPNNNFAW